MKVSMIGEVIAKPTLRTLARIASQTLEGLMGPSGDEVEAEWALVPQSDTELRLTLRDAHGAVAGRFRLEEFVNLDRIGSRLSALWNDLLDEGPKSSVGHLKTEGVRQGSKEAGAFPFAAAGTQTATRTAVAACPETAFTVAAGAESVFLATAAHPFPDGAAVGRRLFRLVISGGKRGVKPPRWDMTPEAYANWKNILSWSGYRVDEREV